MGLLVLSRFVGEEILINENIRVVICGVRGEKVIVGVDAPRELNVRRGELDPIDLPRAAGEQPWERT